jgi:hypothetical protein
MEYMSVDQLARAMDLLTQAVAERPDNVHMFWLREVLERRNFLCVQLPVTHEYRGGEYCD